MSKKSIFWSKISTLTKAIQNEDWEKVTNFPNGPNYIIKYFMENGTFNSTGIYVGVSELLSNLKMTNTKLEKATLTGLHKLIKNSENGAELFTAESFKLLMGIFEEFDVDQNGEELKISSSVFD